MIILLLGTHIFLTIRLKFPQRKLLTAIKLSVRKDSNSNGDVSQFGALATALAATIGTGNIIGVATAVALGGPGAVLWCWLTGFFGISTKYAEGLLAIKYRVKKPNGKIYGGPMYALERGLGWRKAAILFAVFTALAAFGIGNTVQANAISTLVNNAYGVSPWICGAVVCALTAAVILGGIKSISKVCSMLVPFMAVLYVAGCIVILCINISYVIPAIKLIISSAFTERAAGGGFAGSTLMLAARYGIARGLFSNESGMGSAPIVASAAQTKSRTAGSCFIYRHILGYRRDMRPHRYSNRKQHHCLSRHKQQRRCYAHAACLRQNTIHRGAITVVRTSHLRLQHNSRLGTLRRTRHRILVRQETHIVLPHALHHWRFHRKRDEP